MKNKLLKKLLLPFALLLGSFIYAQTVTGTVSDASGPLPGVNVLVKGKSINGKTPAIDADFKCENALIANNNVNKKLDYINSFL